MPCNVELTFVSKRETISWLIDVIDMGDVDHDINYDTLANETNVEWAGDEVPEKLDK